MNHFHEKQWIYRYGATAYSNRDKKVKNPYFNANNIFIINMCIDDFAESTGIGSQTKMQILHTGFVNFNSALIMIIVLKRTEK